MQNNNALIIFIKNAIAGKVKTRLAATIGNNAALKVYKNLLKITQAESSLVNANRYLYYNEIIEKSDDWSEKLFTKHLQKGNNLGDKMKNAFENCFNLKYKKVVIIGSDCPKISAEIIETAFTKLNEYDVVIGPAKDGGYYLMAMKSLHHHIFDNKNYSTSSLLIETIKTMEDKKLSYFFLKELNDIDNIDDLKEFENSNLKE